MKIPTNITSEELERFIYIENHPLYSILDLSVDDITFSEIFDQGHKEGYEEGYEDGYNDCLYNETE